MIPSCSLTARGIIIDIIYNYDCLVFTQSIGTDGPKILHISEISIKWIDFSVSDLINVSLIPCVTVGITELQCTEIIAESKSVHS